MPEVVANWKSFFRTLTYSGIQFNITHRRFNFWIPDTMKNMVAIAPYFSIVRE